MDELKKEIERLQDQLADHHNRLERMRVEMEEAFGEFRRKIAAIERKLK